MMNSLRDDLRNAERELDNHYDEIRSVARERLGRLYNPDDYPASMVGLFEVSVDHTHDRRFTQKRPILGCNAIHARLKAERTKPFRRKTERMPTQSLNLAQVDLGVRMKSPSLFRLGIRHFFVSIF